MRCAALQRVALRCNVVRRVATCCAALQRGTLQHAQGCAIGLPCKFAPFLVGLYGACSSAGSRTVRRGAPGEPAEPAQLAAPALRCATWCSDPPLVLLLRSGGLGSVVLITICFLSFPLWRWAAARAWTEVDPTSDVFQVRPLILYTPTPPCMRRVVAPAQVVQLLHAKGIVEVQ
jgi:hypothetical protein